MIFKHDKLDNLIKHSVATQLSFVTKKASDYYKKAFLTKKYIDITHYFTTYEVSRLPIQEIQEIINENHTIFDINVFYDHWVILHGRGYTNVTWGYYFTLKNLLQSAKVRMVVFSHARSLIDCQRHKIEHIDNILFCDFLDVYINPLYYEYKLHNQDMKAFNEYISMLAEAGVQLEKHNVIMIQYMKLSGNATEKIYM